jgi:predicted DNA-binding protein with PD1-like motif/glutaredoxin
MRALPLHLEAGADIRRSLEALAQQHQADGFVLSVVGNLRRACFACPGRSEPTVLEGELEIITLQGTLGPGGVHLHLSFSDADCQVWGGHLEHGSQILKGADLLVGFLTPSPAPSAGPSAGPSAIQAGRASEPRVQITVAEGCPWSARALRMLRSLGIPHHTLVSTGGPVPQISIDGTPIGGYDALAELHGRGGLEALRQP